MSKNSIKRLISNFLFIVVFIATLWVAASWIDVNAHNQIGKKDYQQFQSWNFFILLE